MNHLNNAILIFASLYRKTESTKHRMTSKVLKLSKYNKKQLDVVSTFLRMRESTSYCKHFLVISVMNTLYKKVGFIGVSLLVSSLPEVRFWSCWCLSVDTTSKTELPTT